MDLKNFKDKKLVIWDYDVKRMLIYDLGKKYLVREKNEWIKRLLIKFLKLLKIGRNMR